ncbi:MAG: hypothetical protein GW836_10825 [Paraglaciecola sp.]|nr:hypothetical protein [Paraglaciecola sp.]
MKVVMLWQDLPEAVLVFCVAALIVSYSVSLVWATKRLGPTNLGRLLGVYLLNTIALVSLCGLLFDIQYPHNKIHSAILFSPGTSHVNTSALSEEFQALQDDTAAFSLVDTWQNIPELAQRFTAIRPIFTPEQLLDWLPTVQELWVLGYGLSAEQWQNIKQQRPDLIVHFVAAQTQTGLVDIHWPRQRVPGQIMRVSATLHLAKDSVGNSSPTERWRVNLHDPMGQVVDSTTVKNGEHFALATQVSASGQWLYQLSMQINTSEPAEETISEWLAVDVGESKIESVLIVQSAPSFETRQLKDWLSQSGAEVEVISSISKHALKRQLFNQRDGLSSRQWPPSDVADLENTDLILLDGRALTALSADHISILLDAVKRGLGLLIVADESLLPAKLPTALKELLDTFTLAEQTANQLDQALVATWADSETVAATAHKNTPSTQSGISQITLTPTLPSGALTLGAEPLDVVVSSSQQTPLVAVKGMGLGKVGISIINHSYQWHTSGYSSLYSHYWQTILAALVPYQGLGYWLKAEQNSLDITGHSQRLCALTSGQIEAWHTSSLSSSALQIWLSDDALQSHKRCTTLWPHQAGWHKFSLRDKESGQLIDEQFRYVYAPSAWQAWQQRSAMTASERQVGQNTNSSFAETQPVFIALNQLWWWLALLLSCSLLWLEQKRPVV